jgi:hypothetical protein
VITGWRSGIYTAKDVQMWASFVRRGYVSQRNIGEARPISIAYDTDDEALIVEIVGRFDEIGDKIDGEIDDNERKEMLRILEPKK